MEVARWAFPSSATAGVERKDEIVTAPPSPSTQEGRSERATVPPPQARGQLRRGSVVIVHSGPDADRLLQSRTASSGATGQRVGIRDTTSGGRRAKIVPVPPGIALQRAPSSNPPSGGSSAGPDDTLVIMSGNGKVEIEWNDALEELMCQEAEKCSGLSWLHSRSETYYAQSNNVLQMLMMILSALTGATSVGTTALFPQGEKTATVILGCVSIVVTILGLIDSRFAFGKRAEGHRLGAVQYAQIHRMIHIEMSLPRHQRMVPKQLLRYVKDDLKRLMESLPRVPEVIIQRYRTEIIPRAAGVSHPDITNGVHRVEAYGANKAQPASSASDDGPQPVVLGDRVDVGDRLDVRVRDDGADGDGPTVRPRDSPPRSGDLG